MTAAALKASQFTIRLEASIVDKIKASGVQANLSVSLILARMARYYWGRIGGVRVELALELDAKLTANLREKLEEQPLVELVEILLRDWSGTPGLEPTLETLRRQSRPTSGGSERLQIRVSKEERKKIEAIAQSRGVGISDLVREWITIAK